MLVKMTRSEFDQLDDFSLMSACFTPLIQRFKEIRFLGGDSVQFYRDLTMGQQAMFIFKTHYDHVHISPEKLYWWSAYYMAHGRWPALKKGLDFLEDPDALKLYAEINECLINRNHPRSLENFDVSYRDFESDSELASVFTAYYERYQVNATKTIERIGACIRNHPSEFVEMIEN